MTTKRRIHGFQQQHKNELVNLNNLTTDTARRVLRACMDNFGFQAPDKDEEATNRLPFLSLQTGEVS